MTFSVKHVVGVASGETRRGFFGTKEPLFGAGWDKTTVCGKWTLADVWTYVVGCHVGHLLEFSVALLAYWLFFADGSWELECRTLQPGWITRVLIFHLACEIVLVGCWHWLTHVSDYARGIRGAKFNPENPYTKTGSVHLRREMIFTTLGWLQSGVWQIALTYLWASKRLPNYYTEFWAHPTYSVLGVAAVTYWREIHFYWCHRGMHPWWDQRLGLLDGDVGAWLYRVAHKLHHKSYNPGPWSGLSMHPLEHFLYYSWVSLFFFRPSLVLFPVFNLSDICSLSLKRTSTTQVRMATPTAGLVLSPAHVFVLQVSRRYCPHRRTRWAWRAILQWKLSLAAPR